MMERVTSLSPGPEDREFYHRMLDKYLDERPVLLNPSETRMVTQVECNVIWDGKVPVTKMTRRILVVRALKQEEILL